MRFRRTAEAEHVCFPLLGKFCIICRVVVEVSSCGGFVDVVSRASAAQILGGGFGTVLACALPFAPVRTRSPPLLNRYTGVAQLSDVSNLRIKPSQQTFATNLLTAVMRLPAWAWPLE